MTNTYHIWHSKFQSDLTKLDIHGRLAFYERVPEGDIVEVTYVSTKKEQPGVAPADLQYLGVGRWHHSEYYENHKSCKCSIL